MRTHNKILLLAVAILFVTIILFSNWAINNVAPYAIIKPYRTTNKIINTYLKSHYKEFEATTNDNLKLVAYLIKSKLDSSRGTIVILHGIGSNKESQINAAEFLSENGFNSVIFDLRAQGESGGKYCTYGYYEKYDVTKIIDKLCTENINVNQIGIMGTSLGGAIAIQAMSIDKRIKCGVIISTFSSLNTIAYDYMKRMLYIPFKFVSDEALDKASKIAKFPADEINTEDYAKKIFQPVLIIHGSSDDRINIKYGRQIFRDLKSKEKRFYEVKNADHTNVSQKGGKKYQTEILNFFNSCLNKE